MTTNSAAEVAKVITHRQQLLQSLNLKGWPYWITAHFLLHVLQNTSNICVHNFRSQLLKKAWMHIAMGMYIMF